ncbi:hypothetical protein PsorP6_001054 [Peronosclerospora sorghi]|uniref:Uncharacterized protein n=1 Tax=Peronosclerospora sorghi TaxID=230839 RepID=A0ACC0WQT0_9STRA|nr:hypothetical protein PsorP6_001054 [Peronosclerospora sorghi]
MGTHASKKCDWQAPVPGNWNASHIPTQQGKVAIVTGANSGIGFVTARELARHGAHVILACRNRERGLKAQADIEASIASSPEGGRATFWLLDVADLSSVHHFCEQVKKVHDRVDIIVANAGIIGGRYTKTLDGYELQFATNYLGHFALIAQLFPLVKKSAAARIVTVSSFLHRHASLFFDENHVMVENEHEYGQVTTYAVTKLCNLLFMFELDRRLKAAGLGHIIPASAHPGYCDTMIMKKGAATNADSWFWWLMFRTVAVGTVQSPEKGALSILYAATAKGVRGGDYYGPKYLELYGSPAAVDPSSLSKSETAAVKLWEFSEKLTHIKFDVTKE